MKALIIPLSLLLIGSGAGVGAGLFLAPSDAEQEPETEDIAAACVCPDPESENLARSETDAAPGGEVVEGREYVRLNNQFVVPVVEDGRVAALVVLSLSVEVTQGARDAIFNHEPKLRDAFLQVMFDHANIGGFGGNFTSSSNMRVLRGSLREAAQATMGEQIVDVLIVDIVRQDVQE